MKKITLLLALILTLSCVACTAQGNRNDFTSLYEAFVARGVGVSGYEVTEIEEYEGMEFFLVRVCLNEDDALVLDDYMWFEAEAMYFADAKEADAAYQRNQQTGIGGTCLRKGNILLYWMDNDPFGDLYKEVFSSVFG